MKRWQDPFPPTPPSFHDRVERALGELEEDNMSIKRNKWFIVAIAALIALLAATAVATVIGQSRLKEALEGKGLDEVAGLVQEVHLGAAEAEDFRFTVDELIWEDENLFITYSIHVPEDGKYLVALETPRLNGHPLIYDPAGFTVPRFIEDRRTVLAFGGDYGFGCTDLLTFAVDSALKERRDNALSFKATLMRTDCDFEASGDFGEFLNPPHAVSLLKDEFGFEEDSPEAAALLEKVSAAKDEDGRFTLEALDAAGIVSIVDARTIDMALDAAALPQALLNDVEQHDYDVKGVRLHIDRFRMSHTGIRMAYTISVPSDMDETSAAKLLNAFSDIQNGDWGFCTVDGRPLEGLFIGGSGGGGAIFDDDGTFANAYEESLEWRMFLPLDGLSQICFAPASYPEGDGPQTPVYDMANAVLLTPTFNPAIAEAEAKEGAARAAIREEYDGDAVELVYATENGIWYHTLPNCTGMMNAHAQSVGDAVAAGKRPCPRCAGGDPNDITESANDECISN